MGDAVPGKPPSPAPVGAVLLALLAGLLYFGYFAGIADAGRSDAAGNGITDAFLALFGGALWIALAGLLLIAFKNGKMPKPAAIGALVLLPIACYAFFASASLYADQRGWVYLVPAALPQVIVLYALWIRIPAFAMVLSETIASAVAGAAVVVLIAASVWASHLDALAAPARREAERVAYETMRVEQERVSAEDRTRDEAKFASLGRDSPLSDYLEYLNGSDSRAQTAMQGARHANRRQSDATALLKGGRSLTDMRELW